PTKLEAGQHKAAKDEDILGRRRLLLDIDPERPDKSKTDATDLEKQHAFDLADEVAQFLLRLGWPAALVGASANGPHLIYPMALPNDRASKALAERLLRGLSARFSNDTAEIDTSVYNASRIAKLPGSWSRKGDGQGDRPHRQARVLLAPAGPGLVTAEMIEAA